MYPRYLVNTGVIWEGRAESGGHQETTLVGGGLYFQSLQQYCGSKKCMVCIEAYGNLWSV